MTTLYIYDVDTLKVVKTYDGQDEEDCLSQAESMHDWEQYGSTFTPAFGFNGGLS